ncbi:MAG TPA: histone deacetylase [Candidatus Saccharicenans sp.]|jgi:acetoin utilization deacetylase AcuC-like enzyme|nr:histone deacetylase [Candidatus Saccharicenans sp.]
MTTGLVFDRRFALHEMGPDHIESPLRIITLNDVLTQRLKGAYVPISPRPATEIELALVHLPSYISFMKETSGQGYFPFDTDTIAGPRTYEIACLAAGAGLVAAELILTGQIYNAFALVRPPGHHAESDRPMGFCFFNNIAITAEYLRRFKGIKKIMIIDWDLHHGNGTQKAFYSSREVLYISLHQSPLFPGTGSASEVGEKDGLGFNLNVPLKAGKTDEDYLAIFQKVISPVAEAYGPEFILVSAGFDILKGDPLGRMELTPSGCGDLTALILDLARNLCSGRLLYFLEGGYNLKGLQDGAEKVVLSLTGRLKNTIKEISLSGSLFEELSPILRIFKYYWPAISKR